MSASRAQTSADILACIEHIAGHSCTDREEASVISGMTRAESIEAIRTLALRGLEIAAHERDGHDSRIDHPAHYGGAEDPYEAIRVIEAWGLGFCLGNALKYIRRAGFKEGADDLTDLRKGLWYLQREIERREQNRSSSEEQQS
jgi:hypothetical protein